MDSADIDILVDVSPDLVVYRVNGKWQWSDRKNRTREEVVELVIKEAARHGSRAGLLLEAAHAWDAPSEG